MPVFNLRRVSTSGDGITFSPGFPLYLLPKDATAIPDAEKWMVLPGHAAMAYLVNVAFIFQAAERL